MKNYYQELIDQLNVSGVLKSPGIIDAFRKVLRRDFLPEIYQEQDYFDAPIPIGYGQTNSQPTTVAFMLELLQVQPSNSIKAIGSGSGWTTALLAYLTGRRGKVIGVEKVKELVKFGQANLAKYKFKDAKIQKASKEFGIPGQKFDRILVSAAAEDLPEGLLKQLKDNGTLVIPIVNSVYRIKKDKYGEISKQEFYGFSFVPLIKGDL